MKKMMVAILFILLSITVIQAEDKIVFKSGVLFKKDTYNEDIKNILKEIAKKDGYQIRFDDDVKGQETFDFNMPLEGAFNMIVDKHHLHYKVEGKVIIISGGEIKKKIIVLKYLKATNLKKLLNSYHIIDNNINRLEFGKGIDNTVFIEGKSSVISELEELIGQLEKAEELKKSEREKAEERKLAEEDKKNKAKLAKEEMQRKKEEEKRKSQELSLEQSKAHLTQKIEEQKMTQDDILFNKKLNNLDKKMVIDVIPLKYINVSKEEMEFQGQKIQLESIEDTLQGLLGTNYVDGNRSRLDIGRESAFLKIDKRTNSVIIKDFPERVDEVKRILVKLDKRPKLVEIEVTIAMGHSGFTQELGMKLGGVRKYNGRDYGLSTGDTIANNLNQLRTTATTQATTVSNGAITNSETNAINNSFQSTNLLEPLGALGLSSSMLFLGGKSMLNIQLNAMENEGLGKVLSNPRIITLNNREATIISGGSVSIPTATSDKMSLQTIDTGISINVKPHVISADNEQDKESEILLDIGIEKSSLGLVTREKIETTRSNINSNVLIKNGQTLILGGLFQYSKNGSDGGIPILKDIPLLGFIFKTKNKSLNKEELLFFITPRIISKELMNDMQHDDYMSYKKNLEFHKKILTKDLEKADVKPHKASRSNLAKKEIEDDFFDNDEDY